MKTFTLTFEYGGEAESWGEIRNDAENNKIPKVFIGTKEFVNVVRCGECKHWNPNGIGFCTIHDIRPSQFDMTDWFCKDGKRKENRNEE